MTLIAGALPLTGAAGSLGLKLPVRPAQVLGQEKGGGFGEVLGGMLSGKGAAAGVIGGPQVGGLGAGPQAFAGELSKVMEAGGLPGLGPEAMEALGQAAGLPGAAQGLGVQGMEGLKLPNPGDSAQSLLSMGDDGGQGDGEADMLAGAMRMETSLALRTLQASGGLDMAGSGGGSGTAAGGGGLQGRAARAYGQAGAAGKLAAAAGELLKA